MPDEAGWSAMKRMVAEALELPADGRAAHLDARCPDPALRAEATRLLRACEQAAVSPVLDQAAAQFAGPVLAEVHEQERRVPEAFRAALAGRYTIERELGRGGMATVYLARDERHGRLIALKLLRPELAPDGSATRAAARFQREIEFAARLSHPHILPLHDSGAVGGLLYYITPFVDGETLRERLTRTGRLPLIESLHLLRDVARALVHAHRHGVVHRDIKPANILLNQDGDALVADFGVAKGLSAAHAAAGQPEAEPTEGALILGTPAYMAPEQVTGGAGIDHRVDLYAFGAVAYELLSGAAPFAGRSHQELLAAHLAEVPEPIAARQPEVPEALAALVDRLLAKCPDDRPRDAHEVLQLLDTVVAEIGPGSRERRLALPERASPRRPVIAGTVLAGLVVAILGYVLLGRPGLSPEPVVAEDAAPAIAILPFTVNDPELERWREGMVDLLSTNLDGVGGLRTINSRTVLAEWRQRAFGDVPPRLAAALEGARATGARYAVLGSVVSSGTDLRILADLYDLRTDATTAHERVEGSPDSIFGLVDRLSIALIDRVVAGEAGTPPRVHLASITTSSIQALKAFLEAEALVRRLDFERAIRAYERAVAADSTFALAYRRLSTIHAWTEGGWSADAPPEERVRIRARIATSFERAARLVERLPPRDAAFLRIDQAIAEQAPNATDLARAATGRYPDDPEAWHLLGEAYSNLWWQGLASREERDTPFLRAARLDPTYTPAYVHPLDNALLYADSAQAARLLAAFQQSAAGSDIVDTYRLWFDVAFGDSSSRASALAIAGTTAVDQAGRLVQNLSHPRLLDVQTRLVDVTVRNRDIPNTVTRMWQAQNLLARGRLREAAVLLRRTDSDPVLRLDALATAYVLGIPLPDSLYAQFFAPQPADTLVNRRMFLVALYALDHGQTQTYHRVAALASRKAQELEARGDSTMGRFVRSLYRALEGRMLMLQGRNEEARRTIEPAFRLTGVPPLGLWMAELLAEAGKAEHAIRYLEPFGLSPWVARRLAPLYEQTGERDKALEAYRGVVVAWDGADPEVQPLYRETRAAVPRLENLR